MGIFKKKKEEGRAYMTDAERDRRIIKQKFEIECNAAAKYVSKQIYEKFNEYIKNNEVKEGDKYLFMYDEYLENI